MYVSRSAVFLRTRNITTYLVTFLYNVGTLFKFQDADLPCDSNECPYEFRCFTWNNHGFCIPDSK